MTRNLKDLIKKSFVFILVAIFTLSSVNTGWTQTPANLSPIQHFSIPDSLGKTTDSFVPLTGRTTPLLIHIEDAHAHFATQSKIREILNYLHRQYGVNTVFIEGASGKINTEFFNIFPDSKLNVSAAERWMKEGQFSAAEVFGIENGPSVNLHGVENHKLYSENLREFRETHQLFESSKTILNEWNSRLKQIKAKIYLGDLKKWDESANQFASEKINVLEYGHTLKNLAEKYQISLRKFPHLKRLFDLEDASQSISINEWRKEWVSVRNFIVNQIPDSDSVKKMLLENWDFLKDSEFVVRDKKLLLAKEPRLYFEILVTAGERYGYSFKEMKELPKAARFLISQKEIAGSELFSEISDLELGLGDKLIETRREREVYEIDCAFRHLNRLFHLAVNRNEWNQIRENQKNWNSSALHPRIQKLENEIFRSPKTLSRINDALLSHALNFYRLAYSREDILVQNSLKQMTASRVSKAVLITGGFHSEGIRGKLKKADFGYLSIHPSVVESGEESRYLEIMLGRRNVLPEFYFTHSKINSLAVPAQLPHPARLILRTVLESGSVISQSQSFRDAFGVSFNRLARIGALDGVFPSNPISADVSGTAEDLKIFLETAGNETIVLDIPGDSSKVPSIDITAQSLGSKKHKMNKGMQFIDISKIAIWGFGDPMKTTAAALAGREISKGKTVHVDIYDYERNIKSTELQNHEGDRQPVYDKAKADGLIATHFIEEFSDAEQSSKNIQDWQLKALRESLVVLIDPGTYPSDGSLEFYENYIAERAKGFGRALYLLRQSGDLRPRVFAIRNQVRAHLTEEVMQIILNAYKDESKKTGGDYSYDTGFTVVHVPDLSRGGQQMQDMETQKIIFGFPDLKNVITKDVLKKNSRAIKEFKSVERKAEIALRDLFVHPDHGKDHYLKINARSAELAPFGTQLDLFTKLLTFNPFSQLVHALGGDMEKVSIGTGLDYRIGLHFTKVAFGIGGRARKFIESTMTRLSPMLKKWIETLREANKDQIKWFQKMIEDTLSSHFGLHELSNQEIAVLGVAYKSKNGSLMGSPALDLISWLIEKRVSKIYICDPYVDPDEFLREIGRMREVEQDPVRKDALQRALRLNVFEFEKNPLEAIQKSKAAIIATDHPEFKSLTPEAIAEATKGENGEEDVPLFDGRNLFSPVAMGKAGVNYISIGRRPVGPKFGPTKDWDAIENVDFDKNRTGMKVAMIGGTGYVALTTGAVMADIGHQVTNLEVRLDKVEKLNQELSRTVGQKVSKGIDIGIHEPGLGDIIIRNYKDGRLKYVPSYDDKKLDKFVEGDFAADAIAEAEVVYIGVGTPEGSGGEADLSYILGATRGIGRVLKNIVSQHADDPKYPRRKVIVVKSTVPPFAFEEMKRVLETEFGLKEEVDFDLASNPEFLREGQAVDDVFKPVRTVLGVKSEFAAKKLRELWYPLEKRWPHKVLITDIVTAPLIKYLSNVFLAISISFVNALAWYAQDEGASITQIVQAMKSDHRISGQAIKVLMKLLEPAHKERFTKFFEEKNLNPNELDHLPAGWEHWPAEIKQYCKISAFLGPGIGWGGSCFPKDLKAAKYQYEQVLKRKFGIIDTTIEINDFAPERVYRDIVKFLDKQSTGRQDVPLKGKKITVLGAAFKGDTDDVRETRTLPFVLRLLDGGAEVTVHDPHPKAMANIKALFAETIFYSKVDNPLIAKIRLKPEVAEFKAQLQKAGLKITDSEAQPLISEFLKKIFGTALTFVTNPDFKGDKNMTDDEKREETKKEMKVIAESVIDSDMVVIVTDWEIFKSINLKLLFKKMTRSRYSSGASTKKSPIIFDARNLLTNRDAVSRRFILLQVGERPLFPENRKTSDSSLGKVPNGDSPAPVAEEAAPEGPTTLPDGPSVDASSLGKTGGNEIKTKSDVIRLKKTLTQSLAEGKSSSAKQKYLDQVYSIMFTLDEAGLRASVEVIDLMFRLNPSLDQPRNKKKLKLLLEPSEHEISKKITALKQSRTAKIWRSGAVGALIAVWTAFWAWVWLMHYESSVSDSARVMTLLSVAYVVGDVAHILWDSWRINNLTHTRDLAQKILGISAPAQESYEVPDVVFIQPGRLMEPNRKIIEEEFKTNSFYQTLGLEEVRVEKPNEKNEFEFIFFFTNGRRTAVTYKIEGEINPVSFKKFMEVYARGSLERLEQRWFVDRNLKRIENFIPMILLAAVWGIGFLMMVLAKQTDKIVALQKTVESQNHSIKAQDGVIKSQEQTIAVQHETIDSALGRAERAVTRSEEAVSRREETVKKNEELMNRILRGSQENEEKRRVAVLMNEMANSDAAETRKSKLQEIIQTFVSNEAKRAELLEKINRIPAGEFSNKVTALLVNDQNYPDDTPALVVFIQNEPEHLMLVFDAVFYKSPDFPDEKRFNAPIKVKMVLTKLMEPSYSLAVRKLAVEHAGTYVLPPGSIIPSLLQVFAHKDRDVELVLKVRHAILQYREDSIPYLLQGLQDSDRGVRFDSAILLGVLQHEPAVTPLAELLKQDKVREGALIALGEIGNEQAASAVIPYLKDEDPEFQGRVVNVLIHIGEPSFRPLIEALKNDDANIRQQAKGTLWQFGTDVIPFLAGNLNDPDGKFRLEIVRVLAGFRDSSAVAHLIRAMGDSDKSVRVAAISGLFYMNHASMDNFLDQIKGALTNDNQNIRSGAVKILRGIGNPITVQALEDALQLETNEALKAEMKEAIEFIRKTPGQPAPAPQNPDQEQGAYGIGQLPAQTQIHAASLGQKQEPSLTEQQIELLGRWEFLKPSLLISAVFVISTGVLIAAAETLLSPDRREVTIARILILPSAFLFHLLTMVWREKELLQLRYAIRQLMIRGDFQHASKMAERLIHSSNFEFENENYYLLEVFESKNYPEVLLMPLLKTLKTRYSFQWDMPEKTRTVLEDFYKNVIQKSPHQIVRDQAARALAELPKKKSAEDEAESQAVTLEQILKKDPQHRISKEFLGKPHLIQLLEIMYKWVPGRTDEQKLKETSDYFRANRRAIQVEAEKLIRTNIRGALFGHVLIEPQFDDDNALVQKSGGGLQSLLTGNTREITREEDLSLKSTYYSLAGPSEIQSIEELLSSKGSSLGEQAQPQSQAASLGKLEIPTSVFVRDVAGFLLAKIPTAVKDKVRNGQISSEDLNREIDAALYNEWELMISELKRGERDHTPEFLELFGGKIKQFMVAFLAEHKKIESGAYDLDPATIPRAQEPEPLPGKRSLMLSRRELAKLPRIERKDALNGQRFKLYDWLIATAKKRESGIRQEIIRKLKQNSASSLGKSIDLKSIEALVEKSPAIKAFVFNVTGTLIDEKTKSPSPQMLIALAKLVNRGKRVVLLWGDRKSLKDQAVQPDPITGRPVTPVFPLSAIPHWINEEEPYNLIKLIHPDKRHLLWFLPYFVDDIYGTGTLRAEIRPATRSGAFGYIEGKYGPMYFVHDIRYLMDPVGPVQDLKDKVVYVGSEFKNVTHSYFDVADVKDFFNVNVGSDPASRKASKALRISNLHGGPEGTQAFLNAVIGKISQGASLGEKEIAPLLREFSGENASPDKIPALVAALERAGGVTPARERLRAVRANGPQWAEIVDRELALLSEKYGAESYDFSRGSVRLINLPADSGLYNVMVTPDGRAITGDDHGRAMVWDLDAPAINDRPTYNGLWEARTYNDFMNPNFSALSPEGRWAYTRGHDGTAVVWNVNSGVVFNHSVEGGTRGIAVMPDGKKLLTVGSNSDAIIERGLSFLPEGQIQHPQNTSYGQMTHLVVDAQGRRAVTGYMRSRSGIEIWDLVNKVHVGRLTGFDDLMPLLAMTPDGRRAIGVFQRGIVIWDLDQRTILHQIDRRGQNTILAIAALPDSKRFVTGDSKGDTLIWDIETGHAVSSRIMHHGAVTGIAVNRQGNLIVSVGANHRMCVLRTDEVLATQTAANASSLGFFVSESAKKLVDEWVNAQMIDAGRQFVNSVIVQPVDISPDARVAAGRIFASVKSNLPGELVVPVEAQSDESLLKILEPIALQLRGESKKDVSIFTTSALKSKIESMLKSLKVDESTIHDYVHFKSSHESLELYLIGRTAKFGEGRVVLIGDSGVISNVAVPGVRKISRDQVRSGQATQDIQQKDRLIAQVAAIDLGFDLLSASEWIPQPDKLQQDGNMLFMKEDFFTQYAEKWVAQIRARLLLLIAA